MLSFNDKANDTLLKVYNTFNSKNNLYRVCDEISKQATKKMTPEMIKDAKKRFNTICNYSKRKEDNIPNTYSYYNTNLCLHLMRKTFKKSGNDSYDSFLRIKGFKEILGEKKKVNITCLGGGPGSDLTGALTYCLDNGIGEQFGCMVLDYNWEEWSKAAKELLINSYKKIVKKE